MIEQTFFLVFAVVAVLGALMVVFQRNPLHSALSLIMSFIAFAGIYVMLKAQFIAAIQIIVYAGAIIVLFVFVIMLLNVRSEESRIERHKAFKWLAAPFAAAILGLSVYAVWDLPVPREPAAAAAARAKRAATAGTTESIGKDLFTTYLLPFEATSVLIIMAIVGAMVLARRHAPPPPPAEEEPEAAEEPEEPSEAEEEQVEV